MKRFQVFVFSCIFIIIVSISLGSISLAVQQEPVIITVFCGDYHDQPAANNKIYQKIEAELGVKFVFEFPDDDLNETIQSKIANGNYQDLINGGYMNESFEAAGAMINLLPYINQEDTPNLYEHLYTDNRISQLVTDDGQLYVIPNYGINYNEEINLNYNGPAFHIQKKVVAWNNYQIPTTLNEYFDLIERYVAANPTDENGKPYTGFEIMCEDWRNFCLLNPVQHLMGRHNDGSVIVDASTPEYNTETYINQTYAKAYYAKLNEVFNKGLINENTFSMDYDKYIETLASGNVLGLFDQSWDFSTASAELYESGRYEDSYLAIPLVYDPEYVGGNIIDEHYMIGSTMSTDQGFGISVTCEDPERLIELFDTLLSDEWQTILQWGIEGEDYYIENGRMMMTEEQYNHYNDPVWQLSNKATELFTYIPKKQGLMENGNSWSPSDQPEILYQTLSEYDQAFLAACDKKSYSEFFNSPIHATLYGEAWMFDTGSIDNIYEEFLNIQASMLPLIIQCQPEELDELWNSFIEQIDPYATEYADYIHEQILNLVAKNGKPVKRGTIILPANLSQIEDEAFFGVKDVKIYFPSGITSIGKDAFDASADFYTSDNPNTTHYAEENGNNIIISGIQ